jgi:lipopolysaccharide/colanic/teichoic acid biosynthesis glycosyltransferase
MMTKSNAAVNRRRLASETSIQGFPLQNSFNRFAKRTFDLVVSVPVAVLLLPCSAFFFLVLQRLWSPGRLLCIQSRVGMNGRYFTLLKFRTMHEESQGNLAHTAAEDPHFYPFAFWLRRRGIDEIPQFLNVIWGEMSIVGPRPYLPTEDEVYTQVVPRYCGRSVVRPGITGLAQVLGLRGALPSYKQHTERVEADIHYIMHWSLLVDIMILCRTAMQLVMPRKVVVCEHPTPLPKVEQNYYKHNQGGLVSCGRNPS